MPTSRPQAPLNIIDVGGNIGLFALYCLEHTQGHIGRLVTLEPVQETYELLLHNLDVFFDYNDTYLDGACPDSLTLVLALTRAHVRSISDSASVGYDGR